MAKPLNAPRGYHQFIRVDVGGAQLTADSSNNLKLSAGLLLSGKTTEAATQNSTGFLFPDEVRLSGLRYVGANSTAFKYTTEAALPSTDGGNYKWTYIVDSTGRAAVAVNTTGTTWKYLNTTSVFPT